MVLTRQANTLERKILFFRADIGVDEGGKPLAFDPSPALTIIGNLSKTGVNADWYEPDEDGNALCLLVNTNGSVPAVRFCRVRRNGLPQLERGGQIQELNLGPDTGLLEAIHVKFFPNSIVGTEYNHFGPRISRLGGFLHEKSSKAVSKAMFRPILRGDAAEQLDRLTDLRSLEFSILPSYVETVRQASSSLADAFTANSQVLNDPQEIQLVLKPSKPDQPGFLSRIREPLRSLVGSNGSYEGAKRLKVKGKSKDSGLVEIIDLLEDQLISTKAIVRMNQRTRALDPEATFQAIQEAYEELHDQLESAASVSP